MFKKKGKLIVFLVMCIFVCMLCTGCEMGGEPSKMKVTSGKKEIPNLITKEKWGDEEGRLVNPFQVYVKKNKKIVSLKTGDSVTMEFVNLPEDELESVTLQVYALNEDGTFTDEDADPQKVEFERKDKKVEFKVPEYSDKADAYGYDLRCVWGENICRYNFIIK